MINRSSTSQAIPINVVGSSTFGRYPKISAEKTYNMFESDNFMVPYSGYLAVLENLGFKGRAAFASNIYNAIFVVVGANVYKLEVIFNPKAIPLKQYIFNPVLVGMLSSNTSDVYIAENLNGEVLFSDSSKLYIYNESAAIAFRASTTGTPGSGNFQLDFIPGYITFHDTYFIAASLDTKEWRLSASNDGLTWLHDAASTGELETKADNVVAVQRFPSRGNLIFVFGKTVVEPWYDVGYQLFPYQRNTSVNIDYGCVNPSTIAAMDEYIVWLGQNEKSGPIVLISNGGVPEKITTDGFDYLLSNLGSPADSEAFMYRQDGHLFYHINFYKDNISFFIDLNNKKIYHASDENMNYFIAKDVAFLNNQYYFVSKNDGNFYAFDTLYTTYNGKEIPRVRVCKSVRLPSQEYFIGNDIGFTVEQGNTPAQAQETRTNISFDLITEDGNQLITQDGKNLITQQGSISIDVTSYIQPRIDFSFSIDGGESFSNYMAYNLNRLGQRRNMLRWWQLGLANDFIPQFRFWGMGRFVATDGILNVRQ